MTEAATSPYDPVVFDLVGQYAFENLADQPFHAQLDELQLPPNIASAWSNVAFHARSATAAQTGVVKTLPSSVLDMIPKINHAETEAWWNELRKSPTSTTWCALRDRRHPSQTHPTSRQPTAPPRPIARPLQRRGSASQTDDDAFYRRSKRDRTPSKRLSGFDTDQAEGPASKRAKPDKGKGRVLAKRQPETSGPSRPQRSATRMSALERREQDAAMHNRAPESNFGDSALDDFGEDEVAADSDEDSQDPDQFRPGAAAEDDSGEEAITTTPTPRGHKSKRPGAVTQKQHGQHKRNVTAPSSKSNVHTKKFSSRSKAYNARSHSDVEVADIEDDSEKEEDPGEPVRGVGSKGSKYVGYYRAGKKTLEWKYPRGGRPRYQATVQLFRCRFRERDIPVTNDTPSPLALHLNLKQKTSLCPNIFNPKDHSLRNTFGPYVAPALQPKGSAPGSSFSGAASGTGQDVVGWMNGHRQRNHELKIEVVRRHAAEWLVRDCLPFTTLRTEGFQKLIQSLDPAAIKAFMSPRQVQRDVAEISGNLLRQAIVALRTHEFSLQLDEWTTPGQRHAFQAMVASYIDESWVFHSFCVDFKVLLGRHSGATFSGHVVEFLLEHDLHTMWNASIVTDSASAHLYVALGVPKTSGRKKVVLPGSSSWGPNLDDPKRRAKLMASLDTDDEAKGGLPSDEFDEGSDPEDDSPGVASALLTSADLGYLGLGADEEDEAHEDAIPLVDDLLTPSDMGMLETIPEEEEEDDEDIAGSSSRAPDPVPTEAPSIQEQSLSAEEAPLSPLIKIANIVSIARSSPERRRRFLRLAKEAYKDNPKKAAAVHIPPMFNKTRWNSQFFQLRVALRFAKALAFVVRSDALDGGNDYGPELNLKQEEIVLLRRTVRILGYFMALTKQVEIRGPTACETLALRGKLAHALKVEIDLARKTEGAMGKFFGDALQATADKLRPYREKASSCEPLLLAAILDRRNRLRSLQKDFPEKVEVAKGLLRREVSLAVGHQGVPTMAPVATDVLDIDIWARERTPDEDTPAGSEVDEITAYLSFQFKMRAGTTVLQWWKENQVNFPTLAKVARKALAATGSTAEVERTFSAAGRICSVRRRSLSPRSLQELLLANQLIKAGFSTTATAPIPPTPQITPA